MLFLKNVTTIYLEENVKKGVINILFTQLFMKCFFLANESFSYLKDIIKIYRNPQN